ncbi:N-acetylmuramoyl-L-alanine amidase (plasmid) [Bacillus thuringiensis serovar fukuokaensis]|uniref:N-acetylmuramoyl-L-alanine amidase n=1 Tax=Bacillus cereus group TaxID=86661 RepID=UPI000A39A3BC|nr:MULTISPECIES: N-acetylmuramoyl-L-alanine amidase [Bacillus cereus group]MRB12551.1 N-acetylmuramoyl-L-alanine amidase [Bacillus thuringiensis]MEB9738798.1 N-acetylmuramoyl-L-alanine amidase [Bacillus cereus]OTW84348.1 N-acetylmuramoyl-L-alanine amidase [Bacillus thuringiensis serovar jinghongiensis]OTW84536.1 N-acetylmuramoyl-L-alanine amidase [Bacillus thuringiensis serovar sumiyoshiensis]OTW86309.1 N-acetylmuramoyl-L-alanine amidase [Bacillus thuringiensis serovar jinghongiensis]
MTVFNAKEINKVPFESNIIPKGNRNRPAYAMNPRYITIHTTANQSAGADARAHARYVNNGGGSAGVSWHFTVDDNRIVQHLPLNENGWHAGDGNGAGNRSSIGIEICENRDGNFEKALIHTAGLVKFLMAHLGLKIGNVVSHQHWSGKNCPRPIFDRPGGFEGFKKMIEDCTNDMNGENHNKGAGIQGLGIAYMEGVNINLRRNPSTSSEILRKLNKPESYIVWEEREGWLNVGNSWVKYDPSYIFFARRHTSNVGKLVVVDTNELWVYGSADWNDKIKTVKKGEAFTILEEVMVEGDSMYKCKYFYITANSQFVHVK